MKAKMKQSSLSSSESDSKVSAKVDKIMSKYTDDFKEDLLGINLVINGICTMQDLRENMSLEDVLKCTEALYIKSEMESMT